MSNETSRNVFRLDGHENPLGRYPAPVVPIGWHDGRRQAAYLSANGCVKFVEINEDENVSSRVEYTHEQRSFLSDFRYDRDRLFAFNKDDVVRYEASEETAHFRNFIVQRGVMKKAPFVALSMARNCADNALIVQVLEKCLEALAQRRPDAPLSYLQKWYDGIRAEIGDWLPDKPFLPQEQKKTREYR